MHDMTAAQVVSSSRVLVDRGSTAVMGSIHHGVRLTSARMIDMIDFYQFLAFIIHCAYAFLGFSWGMVRVGAQGAKSSVVTGPRMAITTSRWTFSLLDASASAEPYRFSLFSLGWELVGVCWATHSEWIFESTEPILNHFTIFSPRTLRIRGVCFEIVALFPLFPGQNEMATVSAVYSVLGFKLIEATDPGYPQSIPMRQTFRTLARQSFKVLLFLPATFLPMF